MGYRVQQATLDIDVFEKTTRVFSEACEKARKSARTPVPVEVAAIADAPYDYDDRLECLDSKLEHLTVYIPERHDLTVMKALRANKHDLQVPARVPVP